MLLQSSITVIFAKPNIESKNILDMLLGLGLGWGCRGMGSCRAPCRPKVYQFPLSPYTAHLQLQETTCSHFGHSRIPAELLYT